MKIIYLKLLAVIVVIATICGYFFYFDAQERPDFPTEEPTQELLDLQIKKPYPLNEDDYVENPGGHFFEWETTTSVSIIVKPTYCTPPPSKTSGETTIEELPNESNVLTETSFESEQPQYIIKASHYAVPAQEIFFTTPSRIYSDEEKLLIVKMLHCEANIGSWDCQVAVCSAILNFIENDKAGIAALDNGNKFSPASYYRSRTPSQMNWEVLNYVLSGHVIANVKYFQLYGYHSFGTPMFLIDGVYFSK